MKPGKWISVAGEGAIRNSKFVLDGEAKTTAVRVYAIYFDRVDVVAADFADDGKPDIEAVLKRMEALAEESLAELRKHTDAFTEAVERDLEPIEQ